MSLDKKVEEITENEYLDVLTSTIAKKYLEYKRIEESLQVLSEKISKGYIIKYYTDGNNIWYSNKEKKHIGYLRKLNEPRTDNQ